MTTRSLRLISTAAQVEISRPSATVSIFLPLRPRSYVERMARVVTEARTAELGEKYLRRDMVLISQDLLKAGADPSLVKREVGKLEGAIRAEIWRLVLLPDGGTR